jgi:hypothetical protein
METTSRNINKTTTIADGAQPTNGTVRLPDWVIAVIVIVILVATAPVIYFVVRKSRQRKKEKEIRRLKREQEKEKRKSKRLEKTLIKKRSDSVENEIDRADIVVDVEAQNASGIDPRNKSQGR